MVTSFATPKLSLGYRDVSCSAPPLAGRRPPSREFHYASEVERRGVPFLGASDGGRRLGEVGCRLGTVAGSFIHLVDRWPHLSVVR